MELLVKAVLAAHLLEAAAERVETAVLVQELMAAQVAVPLDMQAQEAPQ